MFRFLSSLLCVAATAFAPAQTHSASLQVQPGGTTQVTFTVRAPAMSTAAIFGARRVTNGFTLPPYGTLYLDPATGLVELFSLVIGPSGVGSRTITVPTALLDRLTLVTQAAVFTAGSLRLTGWAGIGLRMSAADVASTVGAGYDSDSQRLVVAAYGSPGARVRVYERDGGHLVLLGEGVIQSDGCWMPVFTNIILRAGDAVVVRIGNDEHVIDW